MVRPVYDDSGISEIVGALMLILIVVVGAAGLAMIVSQAEKQQADKDALTRAINSEKLNIMSITPYYNNSTGFLDYVNITVQNVNIDDSTLVMATINNIYVKNLTVNGRLYNNNNRLVIPGARYQIISLCMNDTDNHISQKDPITIQLVTSYMNIFNKTIKPPTAIAKFNIGTEDLGFTQRNYIMLDGSGSYSQTGQIIWYNWTIYDGSSNLTQPVMLQPINTSGSTYQFYPPSNGPFWVKLTVQDDSGLIGESQKLFVPQNTYFNPPLMLAADYDTVNGTIVASLRDANNSIVKDSGKLIYFNSSSPAIVVSKSPVATNNGTAIATVSFVDKNNVTSGYVLVSYLQSTCSVYVSFPVPNANFTSSNNIIGNAPLTVQFNDTSTGSNISSWNWNFHDGSANATTRNVTHTFNESGNYTVTLTVTNEYGLSSTIERTNYITINPSLTVDFILNPGNYGSTPLTIDFTCTSNNLSSITYWNWNFGDGPLNFSNGANFASHVFWNDNPAPSNKSYLVTLTVRNDTQTAYTSHWVTITNGS